MSLRPAPPGFDPEVWSQLEEARAALQTGRLLDALAIYERAWTALRGKSDHFHAMVVAHMAGAAEPDVPKKHEWNLAALRHADAIPDVVRGRGMYPSLYNNLGMSHALQGNADDARRHYAAALEHLGDAQPGASTDQMRAAIERNIARLG